MLRIEVTSNIFNAIYPSYFLNEFETYFDSKSKFFFDLIMQFKVKFDSM